MKVRIVCYEDVNSWILGKFALKMEENLSKMGIPVDIAKVPDPTADINHHIIYYDYNCQKNSIDTLMITHIDDIEKLDLLKKQLLVAAAGICMSAETMHSLAKMGIDESKLCYINPAHDGIIPIRKIVVGMSCRVQEDGRKREHFIDKLTKVLDPRYFKFRIMGDSWDPQVNSLMKKGFEVNYFNHFNYDEYIKFIPSLDYYLYTGMDEGQMGFVDAVAAGVKTIVTSQGYHLDALNAITHPFTTYEELESIFLSIQEEFRKLPDSVSTWNWFDYTKKHVEIWRYLLDNKNVVSRYNDGLNSLLMIKRGSSGSDNQFSRNKSRELRKAKYLHYYYIKKRRITEIINSEGMAGILALVGRKISGIRYLWR